MTVNLETDRLILRQFQESDLDSFAAMSSDPDVMRYIGQGVPIARHDAWRQMATMLGHWTLRGYGFWAVEEKATGEMIGRCGIWNPEGWPGIEVGWIFRKPSWKQGFATEAGGAAMDWAFETLGIDSICSVIRVGNEGSVRVATRLGETLTETRDVQGNDCWIYSVTRERRLEVTPD